MILSLCVSIPRQIKEEILVSFLPIRSVMRTLKILEELNKNRVSTIRHLHLKTKMPKPTIVRVLQTLLQAGYVTNDPRQAGYQVTSKVNSLSAGFHGDPLVVEVGRAQAIALTKKFTWPASIATLEKTKVVVRYSTISDSPNSPFHATVNMSLTLDKHALGLAYLAFCPKTEQEILLRTLGYLNLLKGAALNEKEILLKQSLQRVHHQGFSERNPETEPRSSNTIAVPIYGENRVMGTLGLTYFRSAYNSFEATQKFVTTLQKAAKSVSKNAQELVKLADFD